MRMAKSSRLKKAHTIYRALIQPTGKNVSSSNAELCAVDVKQNDGGFILPNFLYAVVGLLKPDGGIPSLKCLQRSDLWMGFAEFIRSHIYKETIPSDLSLRTEKQKRLKELLTWLVKSKDYLAGAPI